ncbi:MAG: M20 family metallopeptidase [Solirubrobacteraceae bacterium]
MDDLHAQVAACIEAQRSEAVDLLGELVGINSTNPNFPGITRSEVIGGETRCNELLQPRFEAAGAETHWIASDPERKNLVAVRRGRGEGPSLLLNGHVDTVPPVDPENWVHGDPWKPVLDQGYMYGLGTTDMKAGVVAMYLVAQTLERLGLELAGDLQFHSVVGEETWEHELGTSACVEAGWRADRAIVAEPTGADRPMGLATISPGLWNLRIRVKGRSTHAGNRFAALRPGGAGDAIGVNALEKGVKIVGLIQDLETEWGMTRNHPAFPPGFFTILPGVFSSDAGYPVPFYFPDHATIAYDVWHNPSHTAEEVSAEIEAFVLAGCTLDTWMREHPPEFEWVSHYPPFATEWHDPLVAAVAAAQGEVTGLPVAPPSPAAPANFGAVCDASWLQQRGIPCVIFGPGDGRLAHCRDERVKVDQMLEAATTLTLATIDYLGAAAGGG